MLARVEPDVRIHIVGLGPGLPGHVTEETRALLASGLPVVLRTRHHPCAADLVPGASDCDDLYAARGSFEDVYDAVVARILALAETGPLVYAVPGHPLFAERTVTLLLERARAAGLACRTYAAVSFVDAAATALGFDFANVQVCDATRLGIDPQRPALVHQVFDTETATALKLALLDIYPADHDVTVVRAAGTPDEVLRAVPLSELDHRPFGYLDSLFVPALDALEDLRRFDGFMHVVRTLLAEDGCPWDREQTHLSLRPYLLEETYEALEALDSGDPSALTEELGDVLFQVAIHTAIAENAGEFSAGDVVEQISRKLVRRHPHVFADGTASTAAEVERNWEQLKRTEKTGRDSVLDGVPLSLPALAASQSIQGRARKVGFDWPDIEGPLEKLSEEIGEFARATGAVERLDEFGDILFVLVNIADHLGVDAEQALRGANAKFRRRFREVERLAQAEGADLRALDLPGLDALWDRAKAVERPSL